MDAGKHEVLGNFGAEGPDGDEEDAGTSDFLLCLHAPESDLPVVESDLI